MEEDKPKRGFGYYADPSEAGKASVEAKRVKKSIRQIRQIVPEDMTIAEAFLEVWQIGPGGTVVGPSDEQFVRALVRLRDERLEA